MRTTIFLALVLGLTGPLAGPAAAQSSGYDIPAHVSAVDGDALIERADGGALARAEEPLELNLTLIEGDRLRTRAGRAEVLFADGTLLHLDRYSIVDLLGADFARVMDGRVRVSIPRDVRDIVRVDTPAATLELEPGGEYRISVAPNGDAELSVLAGAGAIFNDRGETPLRAGERAVAAPDRAPSEPFYANAAARDDFDRWSEARERAHAGAISVRYLPDELRPYGSVFDSYGRWDSHPEYGRVWYPSAGATWQPYSRGRWHSYPRYGWTWIGYDPWAWPTHHFGRWGFSAGVWFWIPGRSWGPAWVSWARSPGYVGWSPLGRDDHPIYRINVYNSYSSGYPWCGWSFIREREFGGHWRSGSLVHGRGISVIARTGLATTGIAPIAPGARRAVPRGTAVPRSTGSNGSLGSPGSEGRRIAEPRRAPIAGVGSTTGRTVGERRPTGRGSDGAVTTAPPAGRAIRRGTDAAAGAPGGRAVPRSRSVYPYSSSAPAETERPRARERRESPAASAPAYRTPGVRDRREAPAMSDRAPRDDSRAPRVRDRAPGAARGSSLPAPRASSPAGRPDAPRARSRGAAPASRGGDAVRAPRGNAPRPSAGGGGARKAAPRGGAAKPAATRKPGGG